MIDLKETIDTSRIHKALEDAIEDFHYGDTDALKAALTLLKEQSESIDDLKMQLDFDAPNRLDKQIEITIFQAERIAELEAVLQQVIDETAHLDCYSQATTNKILAALPPPEQQP